MTQYIHIWFLLLATWSSVSCKTKNTSFIIFW